MTALTQIPNNNSGKIHDETLSVLNELFHPEQRQLQEKDYKIKQQQMLIQKEHERMNMEKQALQSNVEKQEQMFLQEKERLRLELEQEKQEREAQNKLNNDLLLEKQEVVKEIQEIQTKKNNFCSDIGNIKFIFIFVVAVTVTMNSYYDNILPIFLQDNYVFLLLLKVLLCLLVFFILSKF